MPQAVNPPHRCPAAPHSQPAVRAHSPYLQRQSKHDAADPVDRLICGSGRFIRFKLALPTNLKQFDGFRVVDRLHRSGLRR